MAERKRKLTDTVLKAAAELTRRGRIEFSLADLTVAAWQCDPALCGLAGYETHHPDNHRVAAAIMGAKALLSQRLLIKVGPLRYRLGAASGGRLAKLGKAASPGGGASPLAQPTTELDAGRQPLYRKGTCNISTTPAQQAPLLRLLTSDAAFKYGTNKHDITFADACNFWGASDECSPEVLDKIEATKFLLMDLMEDLGDDRTTQLNCGRIVSASEVRNIYHLHEFLREKFQRRLQRIKSFADDKPAA